VNDKSSEQVDPLITQAIEVLPHGCQEECHPSSENCDVCRWRLSRSVFLKSVANFFDACHQQNSGINPCQLKLLKKAVAKMSGMKCFDGMALDGTSTQSYMSKKMQKIKVPNFFQGQMIDGSGIEVRLSTREIEVLKLLNQDHPVSKLAESLGISKFTFNQHLRSIYTKLSVNTRAGAVRVGHANKVYGTW